MGIIRTCSIGNIKGISIMNTCDGCSNDPRQPVVRYQMQWSCKTCCKIPPTIRDDQVHRYLKRINYTIAGRYEIDTTQREKIEWK